MRFDSLTKQARNMSHERIYRNLETCRSIEGVTRSLEEDHGIVDIYVRTSDVRRLSDFQMWQVRTVPGLECGLLRARTFRSS